MLHILTIAHGEAYVNLFKESCLFSLSMKRNKASLEEGPVTWHIFTDEKHRLELEELVKEKFKGVTPKVSNLNEAYRFIDESQSAFVMVMEECLKDNSPMLFAPPDIFFGDGSIPNLKKSVYEPKAVGLVAHVRVSSELLADPSFKQACIENSISNAELVSFAWKHLHRCWEDAELGHPRQNQWGTGVCWQKIEDHIVSVVHRLPTPYLIYFDKEDLDYFKIQGGFGHFDHRWPGDILLHRKRQRYITSSDVAFMIEFTEPHKNISNMAGDKNDFWQKHFHNEINKQFLITFRAGDIGKYKRKALENVMRTV